MITKSIEGCYSEYLASIASVIAVLHVYSFLGGRDPVKPQRKGEKLVSRWICIAPKPCGTESGSRLSLVLCTVVL